MRRACFCECSDPWEVFEDRWYTRSLSALGNVFFNCSIESLATCYFRSIRFSVVRLLLPVNVDNRMMDFSASRLCDVGERRMKETKIKKANSRSERRRGSHFTR